MDARTRTQMTTGRLTSFRSLVVLLPNYEQATLTWHFRQRCVERGFDLSHLPALWNGGDWQAVDDESWIVERVFLGEGAWSLVVLFDAEFDTPILKTIRFRSAMAA